MQLVIRLIIQSAGVWLLMTWFFGDHFENLRMPLVYHVDAAWCVPGLLERDHSFARVREGDVNVGMLSSIHETTHGRCSDFLTNGVIRSWVMEFALDEVNARQDLLPNITVGFVQVDDCWNDLKALEVAVQFTTVNDEADKVLNCSGSNVAKGTGTAALRSYNVVGVLGPSNSAMSMVVSQFLSTLRIPLLSLYATNNALSDKTKYPYFMRLVPPDIRQEQIILQVRTKNE
jgi:Receptor family ligand binding region